MERMRYAGPTFLCYKAENTPAVGAEASQIAASNVPTSDQLLIMPHLNHNNVLSMRRRLQQFISEFGTLL